MATHYTCDRCGKPTCNSSHVNETVLIGNWRGAWFTSGVARINVSADLMCDMWEGKPAFCEFCKADILSAAADAVRESICDAEAVTQMVTATVLTATGHSSALPCGCDAGAGWVCDVHRVQSTAVR